jgi:hypothetical protein
MGFEDAPDDEMVLDPTSRPDLWVQQGGKWRLRRHADKGHVSSLGAGTQAAEPQPETSRAAQQRHSE